MHASFQTSSMSPEIPALVQSWVALRRDTPTGPTVVVESDPNDHPHLVTSLELERNAEPADSHLDNPGHSHLHVSDYPRLSILPITATPGQ